MELIGKTNIDFIGMRKISFIISSIIAIIGLIGMIQMAQGAANMGIDFSGGTARSAQIYPADRHGQGAGGSCKT